MGKGIAYLVLIIVAIIIIYLLVSAAVNFLTSSDLLRRAGERDTREPRDVQIRAEREPLVRATPESREPTVREPAPPTPPAGFTVEDLSPYYRQVKIGSVKKPRNFGDSVQFRLNAGNFDGEINVAGWTVKSNRGEFRLPQAVADYSPTRVINEDIRLASGEYISIYSWKSPMDRNLRLNKCTGYLNNTYDFSPAIPNNCPAISRAETSTFSGDCQSYIRSLRRCSVPRAEDLNRFSGPGDRECHAFLMNITQYSCYLNHRSDSDFFSREWRVWLNRNVPFDPQHDRILLLDENRLLVDVYTY